MSLAPVITRPELLSRLAALIDGAQSGCPDRIAIDGRDAAGKTTLADELAGLLSKQRRRVIRASVDGFHRTRELRHRQGRGSPEGYYRDAFDYAALRAELLEPLGPRGSRVYRTAVFDPATDSAIEQEPALAPDDAVLLVDGVFLLRPELRDAWDIRIYVSVTQEESLRRALPARRRAVRVGSGDGTALPRALPPRSADLPRRGPARGNRARGRGQRRPRPAAADSHPL